MISLTELMFLEAFGDDQKKKWLAKDPNLTSVIVDDYIARFNRIRKIKPREALTVNIEGLPQGLDRFDISKYNDWHPFELFVDAVGANVALKPETFHFDGKPEFSHNGIEVYYGEDPKTCVSIKGNVNYSWCVAAKRSNMFYSYRSNKNLPSFYFVKDVEATKKELETWNGDPRHFKNKWHIFVIQVLANKDFNKFDAKNYIVTSANNDGDEPMSWNEIVEIQPKLKGLHDKFIPKPLTPDLAAKVRHFKRYVPNVEDFQKMSYEDKSLYIDVHDYAIDDDIFALLPTELKNKYINQPHSLSQNQYDNIQSDKNLFKRYAEISLREFLEWLKDSNFYGLSPTQIDVLIKTNLLDKYVDRLSKKDIDNLVQIVGTDFIEYLEKHIPSKKIVISAATSAALLRRKDYSIDAINWFLNKNIDITKTLEENFDNVFESAMDSSSPEYAYKIYQYLIKKKIPKDRILGSFSVANGLIKTKHLNEFIEFLSKVKFDWNILTQNYEYLVANLNKDRLNVLLKQRILFSNDDIKKLLGLYPSESLKKDQIIAAILKKPSSLSTKQIRSLVEESSPRNMAKTVLTLIKRNVPLSPTILEIFLWNIRYGDKPRISLVIDALTKKIAKQTDRNKPHHSQLNVIFKYTQNLEQTIDTFLKMNVSIGDLITPRTIDWIRDYFKSETFDTLLDFLAKYKVKIDASFYNKFVTKQSEVESIINRNDLNIKYTAKMFVAMLYDSTDKEKIIALLEKKGISIPQILLSKPFWNVIPILHNKAYYLDLYLKYNLPLSKELLTRFVPYYTDRYNVCIRLLKLAGEHKKDIIDNIVKSRVQMKDVELNELLSGGYITVEEFDILKSVRVVNEHILKYKDFYSFLF